MSNLNDHARTELKAAGLFDPDSDYKGALAESVMEPMEIFSKQGHSGCSAALVSRLFNKLSRFQPITPLTGKDDEWNEVGTGTYQNRRCSHVFKEDGKAYNIYGKIFREKNGATFTNRDSRVPVTFPCTPRSV